jgi:hypothetical protein
MRFFNTAGPVDCQRHYCLPPLERLKLNQVLPLIEQQKYFVLYASRQTGKTSSLLALMDYLNGQGQYHCIYINVEIGQATREQVERAMRAVLGELASRAQIFLQDGFVESIWLNVLERRGPDSALNPDSHTEPVLPLKLEPVVQAPALPARYEKVWGTWKSPMHWAETVDASAKIKKGAACRAPVSGEKPVANNSQPGFHY